MRIQNLEIKTCLPCFPKTQEPELTELVGELVRNYAKCKQMFSFSNNGAYKMFLSLNSEFYILINPKTIHENLNQS